MHLDGRFPTQRIALRSVHIDTQTHTHTQKKTTRRLLDCINIINVFQPSTATAQPYRRSIFEGRGAKSGWRIIFIIQFDLYFQRVFAHTISENVVIPFSLFCCFFLVHPSHLFTFFLRTLRIIIVELAGYVRRKWFS